jgi:hypothetical protein
MGISLILLLLGIISTFMHPGANDIGVTAQRVAFHRNALIPEKTQDYPLGQYGMIATPINADLYSSISLELSEFLSTTESAGEKCLKIGYPSMINIGIRPGMDKHLSQTSYRYAPIPEDLYLIFRYDRMITSVQTPILPGTSPPG